MTWGYVALLWFATALALVAGHVNGRRIERMYPCKLCGATKAP